MFYYRGFIVGLDIYQKAIVGVKLSVKDLKKVISPAIYHEQARYDTKTGEVKGYERVLVKKEQSVYAVGPYEFKDQHSIQFKKNNKHELYVGHREESDTSNHLYSHFNKTTESVYIGLTAPIDISGDGGIDGELLDGSISLFKLENAIDKVKGKFEELNLHELIDKVELHFYTDVSY